MAPVPAVYCGTKSSYPEPPPGARAVDAPPGHRLAHVTLIARHGTRTPSKRSLERMRALHAELSLTAPDLPWLDAWAAVLADYAARISRLSGEGAEELRGLGCRFGMRYRALLSAPGARPPVGSASSDARCGASGSHFLAGLAAAVALPGGPLRLRRDADATLRYCWFDRAYNTFACTHTAQVERSLRTGEVPGIDAAAERMAEALGVPEVSREQVRVISDIAAFDIAHGRAQTSPFLPLLHPDDALPLAAFDRAVRPIFAWAARVRTLCAPLLRGLVKTLKLAQTGRAPAADFKFAHSETIVPLLLLLGIDGNGLDVDDAEYRQGITAMSPFAANLALEVFENIHGPGHAVRLRLHERYVVTIPALGEAGCDGVVRLGALLAFFQGVIEEDNKKRRVQ